MGHSDTRQTMRYVHPGESELLTATEIAARRRTGIVPEKLERLG
jgi:hypothetical protein